MMRVCTVYCIAKEIQILRPVEFQNIWLGMGPFHWTKILSAATGRFLEHSGMAKAPKPCINLESS